MANFRFMGMPEKADVDWGAFARFGEDGTIVLRGVDWQLSIPLGVNPKTDSGFPKEQDNLIERRKDMSKTFFGFAVADGMFPPDCTVRRRPLTVDEARERIAGAEMCLNPSHKPTIDAAIRRYGLPITVPERAPIVTLGSGDRVVVMSVRGLPRLEGRSEYTEEEIAAATFVFGEWEVL